MNAIDLALQALRACACLSALTDPHDPAQCAALALAIRQVCDAALRAIPRAMD